MRLGDFLFWQKKNYSPIHKYGITPRRSIRRRVFPKLVFRLAKSEKMTYFTKLGIYVIWCLLFCQNFCQTFSPIFKACKSGTKRIGSPHRTTTPINCVGTFVFSLILETRKTNKFGKIRKRIRYIWKTNSSLM